MRMRLAVWFTLGVSAIVFVVVLATLYHLREELIYEKATIEHPLQPDYVLHGSKNDPEIREIMRDLIIKTLYTAGPILILVIGLGWFLAGRSLRPIAELNRQLADVRPQDLKGDHLVLDEGDREFREHVDNLNSLLGRLGKSFDDLSEYAAKVAHELRTPLTILRLKVESSEENMDPDLCGSLLVELERLSHVVDQSLLIAKAERGSIEWKMVKFDLAETLASLVEDFQLLASDAGRELVLDSPERCPVETDRRYIKQILQSFLTNALKHGSGHYQREAQCGRGRRPDRPGELDPGRQGAGSIKSRSRPAGRPSPDCSAEAGHDQD